MTLKTSLIVVLLTLIAGLFFIWFGVFNISATEKHWPVTSKLIEWVRERSIHVRSNDIKIPPLGNAERVRNGAQNYEAMCAQCHLAPAMEPTELSVGLYPQPPIFYQSDHSMHDPAAIFWTIKNGLKLTGMPSWGTSHTDQQIWELVAFIAELKGMERNEYEELAGEGAHSHSDEERYGHGFSEHVP